MVQSNRQIVRASARKQGGVKGIFMGHNLVEIQVVSKSNRMVTC